MIEYLNELRTVFLGLSFGDQGQFFRRAAIIAEGGFPKLPLMEDVELSLRLRAAGPVLYLGAASSAPTAAGRRKIGSNAAPP